MTVPDAPMFVVVLTGELLPTPRAVGPFGNFDIAQTFSQTLLERYSAEGVDVPTADVVRVESDHPGIVVGEL